VSELAAFGPYRFSLTDGEVRTAAARMALRGHLARRFERDHVAPLVAFVLLLVIVTALAFTGLIGRRLAEGALLIGAMGFLASRLLSHWRLRRALKSSLIALRALDGDPELALEVDRDGVSLRGARSCRRCPFSAGARVENVGGLIYLWPREGEPIPIPVRAFADPEEAEDFLTFAEARMADHGDYCAKP